MMRAMTLAAMLVGFSCVSALAEPDTFIEKQDPNLWRASKLVGVDVLGTNGHKVGNVTDVLLDHDGAAAAVVVGIGGFLGLGRKDVALPYAALHLTDAPRPGAPSVAIGAAESSAGMPTEPGLTAGSAIPVETTAAQSETAGGGATAPAAKGGPVGTTSGVPGGVVTGLAAAPAPGAADNAAAAFPARIAIRPDHATIDFTADQLKAAPAFTYAP